MSRSGATISVAISRQPSDCYAPNHPNLVTRLPSKNVRITAAPVDKCGMAVWCPNFRLPTLLLIGVSFTVGAVERSMISTGA